MIKHLLDPWRRAGESFESTWPMPIAIDRMLPEVQITTGLGFVEEFYTFKLFSFEDCDFLLQQA